MSLTSTGVIVATALFAGMLFLLELGYRVGERHFRRDSATHEGLGVIEAAIFGMLGLILAFVFAGATED